MKLAITSPNGQGSHATIRIDGEVAKDITDEFLREVADVYDDDHHGRPTESVAEHFRTSKRSATRWVAKARERGFLPEYVPPTKYARED